MPDRAGRRWPKEIRLETAPDTVSGPNFIYREGVRSSPYYAGQELDRYIHVSEVDTLLDALREERDEWKGRSEPDISPGDVIAAELDGTIILDDGITTWNPSRAAAFLIAEEKRRTEAAEQKLTDLVEAATKKRDEFLAGSNDPKVWAASRGIGWAFGEAADALSDLIRLAQSGGEG